MPSPRIESCPDRGGVTVLFPSVPPLFVVIVVFFEYRFTKKSDVKKRFSFCHFSFPFHCFRFVFRETKEDRRVRSKEPAVGKGLIT